MVKKSKTSDESDDGIFAVDDDYELPRNRTTGATEREVRSIVAGAVGELEEKQNLKVAESEAKVGKRLEEQLKPLKRDVEVMKQAATETSLGVKSLLLRSQQPTPAASAPDHGPQIGQSYPQAPA